MAILMVVAVLAALMAIAAPFVFSMLQHGRSAHNVVSGLEAGEGAEAAYAIALGQLMRRNDDYFGKNNLVNTANINLSVETTATRDLVPDMTLDIKEDMVSKYKLNTNYQDPRGLIWSAQISDEQGKINVNSAPPALLGNIIGSALLKEGVKAGDTQLSVDDSTQFKYSGGLVCLNGEPAPIPYSVASGGSIQLDRGVSFDHLTGSLVYDGRARLICNALMPGGAIYSRYRSVYEIKTAPGLTEKFALPPEDYDRIERHLTVESGMGSPLWGHGEKLGDQSSTADVIGVGLKNGQGFCPGTLVRIVTNNEPTGFGRVRDIQMNYDGSANIQFEQNIAGSGGGAGSSVLGGTFIEPQLKNPINYNTASDEVLAAVFTGVCVRGSKFAVPRSVAQSFIEFLRSRGGHSKFGERPVLTSNEDFRRGVYAAWQAGVLTLPQRDAIAINASEPNSSRLSLCTVPFIFFSHGSYTIEASGVSNADNGMQLARQTFRQLVTLPTPPPGRFRLQYQAAFQELIDQGMSDRVVTYPTILGTHRFRPGAPLDRFARDDQGSIRLSVGQSGSMLGNSVVTYEYLDHCDDETDPRYRYEGYNIPSGSGFTLPPAQPANNGGNAMGYGGVATPATSVEMWYRPMSNSQVTFYDEGAQDNRNRVEFVYDPSENGLVVRIWDSTLPSDQYKHVVEFVYPITFNIGDWYHVAASWKTSHPGGQEIRVDAKPFPNNDPKQLQFKPGGRLAQDLAVDDTGNISLSDGDGSDFPPAGALQIGEEVIEYTANSGGSFSGIFRGARMTAAGKHKSGEWVVPFGYVNPIQTDLVVGSATLVEDLPMASETHTNVQFPPLAKPNFVLDSATDKIPVADASNFPKSGYILVEGELIFYGSKKKGSSNNWEFDQLQRAQSSAGVTAPARNLHNGSGVSLASVAISTTTDYLTPGIIQVDDSSNNKKVEWLYYADKQDMGGKHFLIAQLWQPGPSGAKVGAADTYKASLQNSGFNEAFRDFRGIGGNLYMGTATGTSSAHTQGTKVIPVNRMQAAFCGGWDPTGVADSTLAPAGTTGSTGTTGTTGTAAAANNHPPVHDSPYGANGISEVSVVQLGQQDGDLMWVKQAYLEQRAIYITVNNTSVFDHWEYNFWVGLNDFVSRRYPATTTRFLRWPTGQLPDAVNANRNVCVDKNGEGKVNGDVDEVRVNTYNSIGGRIPMNEQGTGIQSDDVTIPVENFDAWADPYSGGTGSGQTGVTAGNQQTTANPLNWQTAGLARIEDELVYYQGIGTANVPYYSDVYPQLMNQPQYLNKADHPPRKWDAKTQLYVYDLTAPYQGKNVRSHNVSQLTGVTRGVLGTTAAEHPVGAQVMLMDAMAVTHLTSALGGMTDTFNVNDARGFPLEGYAWIDDEIISYLQLQGTSMSGITYFRGRYGTDIAEHDANAIVRFLPTRYWDRNPTQYDGDGLAFIQTGYRASGARWYGLEFDLVGTDELPQVPNSVAPHVLVRFDGRPAWDTIPLNNTDGYLFEYHGKKGIRFSSTDGKGVGADQMEVRVYWEYLQGAFNKGNGMDWKRTFSIEKMRARYESPLVMRRIDEVEKR